MLAKAYPIGDDYHLEKEIGRGSYGSVVRAKHKQTGKTVAIKKVGNVFNNAIDSKRLLREVAILRQLKPHKNIVRLYDVLQPSANKMEYTDLYYIFESCNTDLRKVIISTIPLQEIHVKVIMF